MPLDITSVVVMIITTVECLIKPILMNQVSLRHSLIPYPTLDYTVPSNTSIYLYILSIILVKFSTSCSLIPPDTTLPLSILSLFSLFSLYHHNLFLCFLIECLIQSSYGHHLLQISLLELGIVAGV